jgi:hypothetical protein
LSKYEHALAVANHLRKTILRGGKQWRQKLFKKANPCSTGFGRSCRYRKLMTASRFRAPSFAAGFLDAAIHDSQCVLFVMSA